MTKAIEVSRGPGRPSTYTSGLAAEILARLSLGEPLALICRDEHMPAVRTVSDWRAANPEFSADFARARDDGFDMLAVRCLDIANTPIEGVETIDQGNGIIVEKRGDMLGHRKLQIETILKLLAKWDPKRYGDRMHTDVQQLDRAGNPTDPAAINVMAVAAAKLNSTERKAMIALYRKMGVRLPHEPPAEAAADE